MSKIISVLEKFNIVEKANQEKTNVSDNYENYVEQVIESHDIDENIESESEVEMQYSEYKDEDVKASEKAPIKQNKTFSIEEIYEAYNLENSNINTVFMLGNFINALPDSLPNEVRKKSVISIVNSSNMDLKKLLGDGEKRLEALNQFSNTYYNSTNDTTEEYRKHIAELRKQIDAYEAQIKINETLLKEQNNIIKYEKDKIESIINFLNNGD